MIKLRKTFPILLVVCLTSGCQNRLTCIQADIAAWRSWERVDKCYGRCVQHQYDFAAGYRAGYRNVALGGEPVQPVLPPRGYWGPKFQTPRGKARIAAWFDGYAHGGVGAECEGARDLSTIPVSPEVRAMLLSSEAIKECPPYAPHSPDNGWSGGLDHSPGRVPLLPTPTDDEGSPDAPDDANDSGSEPGPPEVPEPTVSPREAGDETPGPATEIPVP